MYFIVAVIRGKRYVRMVAAGFAVLAATAASGRAQDATTSPTQFHVGDRISLMVDGPLVLRDTLVVRDGLVLQIPNIGDVPLQGVRRANIQQYLTQQIGKVVKNAVVHALPLVNLYVSGNVARPGFYAVPTDAILSDVVMGAGGPTAEADLSKTVIQRNGKVLFNATQTNTDLTHGKTVEDLQLVSGDQILVGAKSHHDMQTYAQVAGVAIGLVGIAVTLFRH